ncbi:hypothetical protein BH24DEI2_BH24DEI2_13200 [soil metagenome]
MKRLFGLTLLAALCFSAAAQLAPLPEDARFNEPTVLVSEQDGESLRSLIESLARGIGLTPIVDSVPDTNVTINIDNAKPFRQLWNTFLTLNNLYYVLQDNDVVVVGPSSAIAGLRSQMQTMNPSDPNANILSRFYRVNNNPADVALIIRQAVPGAEVSELPSVNSVSVRGTQAQQDEALSVLSQFDQASRSSPTVLRIYTLANAKASTLAEVLQTSGIERSIDAVNDANSGANDGTNANGEAVQTITPVIATAASAEGQPFTVVADDRTNSLIVTASPEIQAQIASLIPQLDVAQQQVNVQVRIQEITSRAANNLGINLAAGIGNFATTILGGSLNFIFDAQNNVSGLNLGAVLDTLESQGLSRRVDDSSMTVLNNGTFNIKSGGRIEITYPGPDGTISQRTINFGVIIEVTPRISSDGRVILDVKAEVSDLLTPFNEGGIPQRIDFSERTVSSTVTLEPGQTVLLGGLIQNRLSQSHTGRATPEQHSRGG